ncbi:MAG: hypothetical protein EXR76_08920 [Myxococcales bacterium]|nr:hypothetical protein [Myxococcales bacterium]
MLRTLKWTSAVAVLAVSVLGCEGEADPKVEGAGGGMPDSSVNGSAGGAGGAQGGLTMDAGLDDSGRAVADQADMATVPPGECPPVADQPCEGDDPDLRPGRLNEHTAVYDDARREMLIFGGNSAIPENCGFPDYTFSADLWIYRDFEDGCPHFTRVEGGGPSARGRHAAAFGESAMFIYGGRSKTRGTSRLETDLWRFDTSTRTYEELAADGGPDGRMNSAMVFDEPRRSLWLFGGNASSSAAMVNLQNDDLWRYDLQTMAWEEVRTTNDGPPRRLFHSLALDGARDRLLVFGGADESLFSNNARYFSDLWALDLTTLTWKMLSEAGEIGMEGRFWSTLVHDEATDRYLVFGGHDDQTLGNRNDTWLYDPNLETWTRLAEGDTFNAPANGLCDFPIDFTNVDRAQPERRNAHSLVYAPSCGHALMFGGKTDCGAIDDVWQFAGEAWKNVVPADEGEACLRFRGNPDNCANLCF